MNTLRCKQIVKIRCRSNPVFLGILVARERHHIFIGKITE